jgi:CBS domain-containing protein
MLRKIESAMQPKVHQLPPNATIYRAAKLMKQKGCGCVVVTDKGKVRGIFTSGDMVTRVAADGQNPTTTTLAEVMTRKPDTVTRATLAIDALRKMHDGHYRHLPVVEKGRLRGIISRRDFFGQELSIIEDEDHFSEVIR